MAPTPARQSQKCYLGAEIALTGGLDNGLLSCSAPKTLPEFCRQQEEFEDMVSLGPAGESQSQWLVSGDSQEGLVIMEEETKWTESQHPRVGENGGQDVSSGNMCLATLTQSRN